MREVNGVGILFVVEPGVDVPALDEDGFRVQSVRPTDADSAALDEADCVVVGATIPPSVCESDVPIVAYAPAVSEVARPGRITGFARRGDVTALEDQIRWALRADRDETDECIERLHEGARELVAAESADELYRTTVEIGEDVLDFDWCYVGIVEGDELVPRAVSEHTPREGVRPLGVDEGIAGETFRTGTTQLVTDVAVAPEAAPVHAGYRSGLSVPIGDVGVFQAAASTPDAFDRTDLELAELLVSHVAAASERLRAKRDLREQYDRLSALFENIPDAAAEYEFGDDGTFVVAVNPAFEELFGYAAEDIIGENANDFIVPPEERAEARQLDRLLQQGQNVKMECRRLTVSGPREFLLHVVPLSLGEPNSGGYAIYTDITEQKTRERELERRNEQLTEFANIVSHDLRNPLAIADGYLELARETGDPAQFERVERALARIDHLTEDLLVLARTGRVIGETEAVDVARVADTAWSGVETGEATLVADDSIRVEADEGRLTDLLENLFRNSVEHGSTGDQRGAGDGERGGAVRVRLVDTADGFAVEDDGPGIPVSERDRLFEPGETTNDDGLGFGLTIVRRIAEAHGWRVEVTESDDGGARFEFEVGASR